jgi:predicted KAP-like P-loop ATPase
MPDLNELLSSDSPLINPDHDELEYSAFAQSIAKAITSMVPSNGLVMSLNGSWGFGKTTALNFIVHYLQQYDTAQKPIIVKFNPWWFSNREDLTRLLISQINTALGKKDYKEIKRKIADFAELISKIPVVPGVEAGGFLADRLRKKSEISYLKDSIGKLLIAKNKKILVIIDDIDRLEAEEIRELFRTIKAVADFPNTIYLLAFDNKVVLNALEKDFTASGSDYLEKIVQVPFSLPIPDKISLQRLLFSKLDHILIGTPSELFDKAYWTNVYFDGIDDLISSPRDVTRLFNALRTTYPALVGEVNPVDLIAIEAIRVFLPQFYEIIREHSELLAGSSPIGQNSQMIADRKATFERWLDLVAEKDRNALKKLMSRLFPRFSQTF